MNTRKTSTHTTSAKKTNT